MELTSSVILLIVLPLVSGLTQLLLNPDFEDPDFHNNWQCKGCTIESSSDAFHGNRSAKISNRHQKQSNLYQTVNLTLGERYFFEAYIKLTNQSPEKMYNRLDVRLKISFTSGPTKYMTLGISPYIKVISGWTKVGGDYQYPKSLLSVKSFKLYFKIKEPEVNFHVDKASLVLIPKLSNWRAEADQRIDQLRKAYIHLRTTGTLNNDTNLKVHINQTRSSFAFGGTVKASYMIDQNYSKFQKFFYDNFNWGVFANDLKWRQVEPTKGNFNYADVLKALDVMRAKNISVRGHNIFWGIDRFTPDWMTHLYGKEMMAAMKERIQDLINHTRGKTLHWDVNNENLHGDMYERHTNNSDITKWMFQQVHMADPQVKLFLNDYNIVNSPAYTVAYSNQGKDFRNSGIPVYGLGVQGHMKSVLDITLIKHRLDIVAEVGLPLWITEMTCDLPDELAKAQMLEDAFRLHFSHPAVEGIVVWTFWDGMHVIHPNIVLATGSNVTPNIAGRRYRKLRQQWTTSELYDLQLGQSIDLRGFLGDYRVHVLHNGVNIKSESFTLDKAGADIEIRLLANGKIPRVSHIIIG